MGSGGRARRDLAAVRAMRGESRAGVDRGRSPAIVSPASISSRIGTTSAARSSQANASSLFGLTLVPRRRVSYGRIDPVAARDVFIREALVPGALATKGAFLAHNRELVADVAKLEHKARRQDVLVDEAVIAGFYAERLPAEIHSRVAFERWRTEAEREDPRLLFLTRETLMRHAASQVTEELYPETMTMAGTTPAAPLSFRARTPAGRTHADRARSRCLNQLDAERLTWLVPGMIREKVLLLLKALPKAFA